MNKIQIPIVLFMFLYTLPIFATQLPHKWHFLYQVLFTVIFLDIDLVLSNSTFAIAV